MKDLKNFTQPGKWLAVVTRHNKIKIVASSSNPQTALKQANQAGFEEASLMLSAPRYASWAPQAK